MTRVGSQRHSKKKKKKKISYVPSAAAAVVVVLAVSCHMPSLPVLLLLQQS
jgi:hypothetical protein